MYEIGEHIIHPGQGVCTVVGVDRERAEPMILLRAKSGHAETHLMYPLSQLDRLHSAITREDAERLLANYASLEIDPFTERNSSLEETHFKQQLKLGAPETVRVAKTMRRRITDAQRSGKKPSSYYTRVLKEAQRRSIEEFAVALELDEDTVAERFRLAATQAGELISDN